MERTKFLNKKYRSLKKIRFTAAAKKAAKIKKKFDNKNIRED